MKHAAKLTPWIVCLTAALFFFYEFVQMSMFNAINPSLITDFNITPAQLGNLSAAYFYANILFMFPAGMLLDRYPVKWIISVSMLLCIIGTFVFSQTHSLTTAIICRFMTGIGGSFPFLSCLKLATRWFYPTKMAFVSGVMLTMAMLGGVTAQTPMTLLVEATSWRQAVFIDSLIGVFFLLLILRYVKEKPEGYQVTAFAPSKQSILPSIYAIVSNKQNWCYGLYTCMLNLPIFLLAQLWGSLYLTEVHHLTTTQASYATSLIFIGTIFGSPFFGWVSDTLTRRKAPMYFGAITSFIIIMAIMLLPQSSLWLVLSLFFALGFFTSTQVISYPAISESNPAERIGGGLGLASVLIMSGGAIFEPLFGWLMQGGMDHAITHTSNHYLTAMSIMPIAIIIGIIAITIAKETQCETLETVAKAKKPSFDGSTSTPLRELT